MAWSWRSTQTLSSTNISPTELYVNGLRVRHWHYPLQLGCNQRFIAKIYYQKLREILIQLSKMQLALVNRLGPVLFPEILIHMVPGWNCRSLVTLDTRYCHIYHILMIYHPQTSSFFKHLFKPMCIPLQLHLNISWRLNFIHLIVKASIV